MSFEVAGGGGAFKLEGGGVAGLFGDDEIMFVLDFSEDLFKDVFEGEDAADGAELVDDEGHVGAVGAELIDELAEGLGFGDDGEFAGMLLEAEGTDGAAFFGGEAAVAPNDEEVTEVDDADDVVGGVFEDRDAGVVMIAHDLEDVVKGGVDAEGDHAGAGGHDFAGDEFAEFEEAVDGVGLEAGDGGVLE